LPVSNDLLRYGLLYNIQISPDGLVGSTVNTLVQYVKDRGWFLGDATEEYLAAREEFGESYVALMALCAHDFGQESVEEGVSRFRTLKPCVTATTRSWTSILRDKSFVNRNNFINGELVLYFRKHYFFYFLCAYRRANRNDREVHGSSRRWFST
jgi:hypothetical protein